MTVADASVYTDFSGLAALRAKAANHQEDALDEVARQFEALFLQQMLKEMRKANLAEGIFDSSQSQFYRDMYDQQLSLHLSKGGGLGLTEVLKRQLGGTDTRTLAARPGLDNLPLLSSGQAAMPISGALQAQPMPLDGRVRSAVGSPAATARPHAQEAGFTGADDFVQRLRPHAREAARMLGVNPDVLIAQAALETGWGKRQMSFPDGRPACNLFGIKANAGWQGDRVAVSTLEYEGGVAVRKREPFRAYGSYRESFLDYANFIVSNPRYGKALRVADDPRAYFSELQKAGYATDPGYANKLTAVLNSRHLR
jgi:flagellar protein FlgJ